MRIQIPGSRGAPPYSPAFSNRTLNSTFPAFSRGYPDGVMSPYTPLHHQRSMHVVGGASEGGPWGDLDSYPSGRVVAGPGADQPAPTNRARAYAAATQVLMLATPPDVGFVAVDVLCSALRGKACFETCCAGSLICGQMPGPNNAM